MVENTGRLYRLVGSYHMPKLLKFVFKNIAIGIVVGWSFVAALLYFDVGGFGTLVLNSPLKWVALSMLGLFFAITFGSAAVASAVLLGHDFNDDEDGKSSYLPEKVFEPGLQPALIPIKPRR